MNFIIISILSLLQISLWYLLRNKKISLITSNIIFFISYFFVIAVRVLFITIVAPVNQSVVNYASWINIINQHGLSSFYLYQNTVTFPKEFYIQLGTSINQFNTMSYNPILLFILKIISLINEDTLTLFLCRLMPVIFDSILFVLIYGFSNYYLSEINALNLSLFVMFSPALFILSCVNTYWISLSLIFIVLMLYAFKSDYEFSPYIYAGLVIASNENLIIPILIIVTLYANFSNNKYKFILCGLGFFSMILMNFIFLYSLIWRDPFVSLKNIKSTISCFSNWTINQNINELYTIIISICLIIVFYLLQTKSKINFNLFSIMIFIPFIFILKTNIILFAVMFVLLLVYSYSNSLSNIIMYFISYFVFNFVAINDNNEIMYIYNNFKKFFLNNIDYRMYLNKFMLTVIENINFISNYEYLIISCCFIIILLWCLNQYVKNQINVLKQVKNINLIY